jgi:hypothetical protein
MFSTKARAVFYAAMLSFCPLQTLKTNALHLPFSRSIPIGNVLQKRVCAQPVLALPSSGESINSGVETLKINNRYLSAAV